MCLSHALLPRTLLLLLARNIPRLLLVIMNPWRCLGPAPIFLIFLYLLPLLLPLIRPSITLRLAPTANSVRVLLTETRRLDGPPDYHIIPRAVARLEGTLPLDGEFGL